jgi:hypothetical protein
MRIVLCRLSISCRLTNAGASSIAANTAGVVMKVKGPQPLPCSVRASLGWSIGFLPSAEPTKFYSVNSRI